MIAETIKKLIDSGDFKKLLQSGIISPKIKTQYEIYERYNLEKSRSVNKCVRDIVSLVADDLNTSDESVFRAIRVMKR